MKFKKSLIIRLINNSEHRALTDVYSKAEESRALIKAMFPEINYYHASLGEILENRVIPELRKQLSQLTSTDLPKAITEDTIEITAVRQTKAC